MLSANNRYLQSMRTLVQAPVIKQLSLIVGLAAAVAIGVTIYMSAREPIYQPINYQVTSQNMSTIVDTLDKAGIVYKINERDGIVYVDENSTQLAKMKLAAAGVAHDESFNFTYLNDQSSFGASQFQENTRYILALENDLAKTISAIEGVSSAKVHIAMPSNDIFADENHRPTASVVLSLAPGFASDKEKIRAIDAVIASSVPGLDPKDVSITDQYGHFLSSALDPDSVYNAEQLNYQNNMQSFFEKRIQTLITPVVGDEAVNVRVYANLDFTQNEEAKEAYDPDQKVVRSEENTSENSSVGGTASGPPGSLSNAPPGEGGEDPKKQAAAAQAGGNSRNHSIKHYELGKTVSYSKSNSAKIVNLSVAVVVGNQLQKDPKTNKDVLAPISQDKLNKISDLIKATIGYDEKRGDRVTVVNSSLSSIAAGEKPVPVPFWDEPWFWDIIKKIIAIIGGFGVMLVLYKKMAPHFKAAPSTSGGNVALIPREEVELNLSPSQLYELKQEQLDKLKELAHKDSNRVAAIIKNWVRK